MNQPTKPGVPLALADTAAAAPPVSVTPATSPSPASALTSGPSREFLARCVSGAGANVVLERIREKGVDAVLAIQRAVKVLMVHAEGNEAVTKTIAASHRSLADFAAVVGGTMVLTFTEDTVFVNGQLLRASRDSYKVAMELGQMFMQRCEISEVQVGSSVLPVDVLDMAQAIVAVLRNQLPAPQLLVRRFPNITLRQVEATLIQKGRSSNLPLKERVLRLYASSLVVMRKVFDHTANGATLLPHRVRRIAQNFVSLAQTGDPSFLGLMAMATAHRDDAGRAVHTAILALVMGMQVSDDRATLANLTTAALLADVGRIRVAGPKGRDQFVELADNVESAVPPLTAAMGIAMAGVNAQNARRVAASFEATWMEREKLLGRLYKQKYSPLLESKILFLAREVVSRLAPRDTTPALSPIDALRAVAEHPNTDLSVWKLLVRAVGFVPVGTVVELETGEWAVVVGASADLNAVDKPKVRLVIDRQGNVLDPPVEFDLGKPTDGRTYPRIARVLEQSEARFNVARVFVA